MTTYQSEWYARNRERLLVVRKKYNEQYFSDPANRERRRKLALKPEQKEKRRLYKLTEKGKLAEKRYRDSHKEQISAKSTRHRLKRYGLTLEDLQLKLKEQKGECAICQVDITDKYHVDHCHKTNRFRALLCQKCNMGIGLFGDDYSKVNKAAAYLLCHNSNQPQH